MRPVCDRCQRECWPLGSPTSEGPTRALEAEGVGFKGQQGCGRALWLCELFYSSVCQPSARRKHGAPLGSLRWLIAGAVCWGLGDGAALCG